MKSPLLLGLCLLASLAMAQDALRLYDDQVKMIDALVGRCVATGGLARTVDPKTGRAVVRLIDRAKIRDAVAADVPSLNPTLRVGLIVRCQQSDPAEASAFVAVLKAVGEASGDGLTKGYASLMEGDGARRDRDPPMALKAYADAAAHFATIGDAAMESLALEGASMVHSGQEDFDGALALLDRALNVRIKAAGERDPGVASVLESIASIQDRRGRAVEAMAALDRAIAIKTAVEGPKGMGVADTTADLAKLQARRGDYAKAVESLERAIAIRRDLGKERDPRSIRLLDDLGMVRLDQRAYPQAREVLVQALRVREEVQGVRSPEITDTLLAIGLVDRHLGNDRAALAEIGRAVEILGDRRGDHARDLAGALGSLGAVQSSLGDYGRAIKSLRSSLDIYRELLGERNSFVATTLVDLANVHGGRGELALALDHLERALAIMKALPGREATVVSILSIISSYHRQRGDPGKALASLEAAMVVAQSGGDTRTVALVLVNIAEIDLAEGRPGPALVRLQKALDIGFKAFGEGSSEVGKILASVTEARHGLGDETGALRDFKRSISIQRRALGDSSPQVALTYNMIGRFHFDRGEFDLSARAYGESLAIRLRSQGERHPNVVATLRSLAAVESCRGDQEAALKTIDRALAALKTTDEPAAIGGVEGLRPVAESVQALLDRGAILQRLPTGDTPAMLREAAHEYQRAASVLDDLRIRGAETEEGKLRAAETAFDLFSRLVRLCGRLAEVDRDPSWRLAAFSAFEQATARVFLENLGRSRAEGLGGVGRDLQSRERDLLASLATLDRQLIEEQSKPLDERRPVHVGTLLDEQTRVRSELAALRTRFEVESPRYHDLMSPRPCSIETARAALADNEVALLYVLGQEGSSLVVVEKEADPATLGISIHPLPPADAIADLVASMTHAKTLEDEARSRDRGVEAFRILLAPAVRAIAGKSLVVVPGGVLGGLPFELLVEPGAGGDRFLVERHSIRYAPSMTVLSLIGLWERARPAPSRPLWIMGDPTYDPSDPRLNGEPGPSRDARLALARLRGGDDVRGFQRLPASGVEVARLVTLLGASPDEVFVGPVATETAVKEASRSGRLVRHRFVHFACHGVLGLGDGVQPALVLSQIGNKDREDGLLRLDEVTDLKLNADLVVLSACETGRGRTYRAEGVAGLARAFLYAGSRGVLCSLWQVDDAATSDLMIDVYEGLRAGQSSAEALRAAQRRMIEAGESPIRWAPFVLIGRYVALFAPPTCEGRVRCS